MSRRSTWTVVGAIWGAGIAMVFGAIPAGAATWGILEDSLPGGDWERTVFAFLWGATWLCAVSLGAMSGYLLGRQTRMLP